MLCANKQYLGSVRSQMNYYGLNQTFQKFLKPLSIAVLMCGLVSGCTATDSADAKSILENSEIIVEDAKKHESIVELHKLANEGVGTAQGKLAQEYYDGIYLKQNDEKALYWAGKAHANKDSLGTLLLARMKFYGEATEQNTKQAIALMETIIDRRIEAAYILGKMYLELIAENPEYAEKGAKLINKAADNGLAVAQFEHAITLKIGLEQSGSNVSDSVKKSIKKSVAEYMSMAADQEYMPAIGQMGLFYMNGYGVPKDEDRGKSLLEIAGHNGDITASECLRLKKCEI